MVRLTKAQRAMLKFVSKRDYPAGEPRVSWLHTTTYAVLKRKGLVEERFPDIVYLTALGRQALAESNNG